MDYKEQLPSDITMVGGTMPGLMFYAGFMEELFRIEQDLQLASISGTSAGAFIAALTTVGKHQETQKILLDTFGNDTGVGYQGVFGKKTIQRNLKDIIEKHVTGEALEESSTQLKTLSLHIPKTKGMEIFENSDFKELIWLLQTTLKVIFSRIGAFPGFTDYEVFDSRILTADTKEKVREIISGSFQYSPEIDSVNPHILRADGEVGSWHESSGTLRVLNENISPQSDLLVLTRFPRGHKSYEAVVTQTAKIQTRTTKIIGPSEALRGNLISTNPEHMRHNGEVGRKTARFYFENLKNTTE